MVPMHEFRRSNTPTPLLKTSIKSIVSLIVSKPINLLTCAHAEALPKPSVHLNSKEVLMDAKQKSVEPMFLRGPLCLIGYAYAEVSSSQFIKKRATLLTN